MPRLTREALNPKAPESPIVATGVPAGQEGSPLRVTAGGKRRRSGSRGSGRAGRVLALGISACAGMGLVAVELEQVQAASPDVIATFADELAEPHAGASDTDPRARLGALVRRATDAVPGDVISASGGRTWPQDAVTLGLAAIAPVLGPATARPNAGLSSAETVAASVVGSPTSPTLDAVVVPDVDGLTVAEAHRQLRAAGVRVSIRDEYGNGVMRDEWRDLKVFRQSVAVGGTIARGSWVHISASYGSRRLVQGY